MGVVAVVGGCNVDGRAIRARISPSQPVSAGQRPRSEGGVDITIADAREVDLVEEMARHRLAYTQALRRLKQYYQVQGYATKAQWADTELRDFRSVKQFRYLMDAEVASDALRPEQEIPEANALYEKGLSLMRRGGHGIPLLFRRDRMVEAARVFRELIERFPNSDKIDDAAFYCGEIHKEYLPGQEAIAVKWYERAWTWNPETPHPARFQAAVVYDYRLHDRDRALELYQRVLKHEADHASNVRFATRRIAELTESRSGQPVTASPPPKP
jgi:tetratricopeptide (TPR) repeat protein